MNIPDFMEELLDNNISVSLVKGGFVIDGFYKSGSITLEPNDGSWVAEDRYHKLTRVEVLEDLVALNYEWWQGSKDRYEGWNQPDCNWLPLLLKYKYVKSEVIPEKVVYK